MIEKISNVVTNVVEEPALGQDDRGVLSVVGLADIIGESGLHGLHNTAFLAQLLRERRVSCILNTGRGEEVRLTEVGARASRA